MGSVFSLQLQSFVALVAALIAAVTSIFVAVLARKAQRELNAFSAEISGRLWIGQKQWELKRDIYKGTLEVVDEVRSVMRQVLEDYKWIQWALDPVRQAALETKRQERIRAARTQIATATNKLHHAAVFSQVVLSEGGSQALTNLVDMLEERGEEEQEDLLPTWIAETDQIYGTLIREAKRELAAIPIKRERGW